MSKETEFTTARIHKKTLNTLKRYAELHNLTFPALLDQIAQTMRLGLDGLDDWTMGELKKHYRYSDFMVCADVRQIFKPKEEKGETEK